MRKGMKALAVVVATAGALLLSVLPASAAQLRPQYIGQYYYDNMDPVSTGCSNTAITPNGYAIKIYNNNYSVIGQIELRYSTGCRTVWARVVNYANSDGNIGQIFRNNDGAVIGCGTATWNQYMGGWTCYSKMLYDGGLTSYAVGQVYYGGNWYTASTGSY